MKLSQFVAKVVSLCRTAEREKVPPERLFGAIERNIALFRRETEDTRHRSYIGDSVEDHKRFDLDEAEFNDPSVRRKLSAPSRGDPEAPENVDW